MNEADILLGDFADRPLYSQRLLMHHFNLTLAEVRQLTADEREPLFSIIRRRDAAARQGKRVFVTRRRNRSPRK